MKRKKEKERKREKRMSGMVINERSTALHIGINASCSLTKLWENERLILSTNIHFEHQFSLKFEHDKSDQKVFIPQERKIWLTEKTSLSFERDKEREREREEEREKEKKRINDFLPEFLF